MQKCKQNKGKREIQTFLQTHGDTFWGEGDTFDEEHNKEQIFPVLTGNPIIIVGSILNLTIVALSVKAFLRKVLHRAYQLIKMDNAHKELPILRQ